MLGRWHGPLRLDIAETDDVKKVYEWTTRWSDLLEVNSGARFGRRGDGRRY